MFNNLVLENIKDWKVSHFCQLIEFIQIHWTGVSGIYKEWKYEDSIDSMVLIVELNTEGRSKNESIVNALLKNHLFKTMWHYSWRRGGHYTFKIIPLEVGFKSIKDFCKEKNFTKQNLYKYKENYDWIIISEKIRLVRDKA